MRNSLLPERVCAEDLGGSSSVPKMWIRYFDISICRVVGERLYCTEAPRQRWGGAIGSENVGMSNHKAGESPAHRKPKVSLAMTISQGLGGPNPLQEVVGRDGQPVNIPAPFHLFQ